jgi:hypothetical protein
MSCTPSILTAARALISESQLLHDRLALYSLYPAFVDLAYPHFNFFGPRSVDILLIRRVQAFQEEAGYDRPFVGRYRKCCSEISS